jgi:microsomal dipeptidase-like Zn-dependent dipeptidase
MTKCTRKYFVGNAMLAALGTAILPKFLRANACSPSNCHILSVPASGAATVEAQGAGSFDPSYFGIVDLHCHPSLKMYLWGRKLWRRHTAGLGVNAFDLQDDMEQLTTGMIPDEPFLAPREERNGFVKGIVVAHYLPEAAIHEQWDILKGIYPWIGRLFRRFADKFEHGDWTNTDQVLKIIDLMEEQACTAKQKKGRIPFMIATNFQQFRDAIRDGKFPIAHAIEGAHALGRDKSDSVDKGRRRKPQVGKMKLNGEADSSQYIKNLEILKKRGVCMMTLAHLFPNDVAYCVEGISPDEKDGIKMRWTYADTPDYNRPLTKVGEDVVDWMLANGMIIDLTHSTPATRMQVFEKNRPLQRPVVFTHTGAEAVFEAHDAGKYPNFRFYCVTDEEIASICACGGTIGVIPEVFWLAGGDTHLKCEGLPPKLFRNGIPYMVETIKYINSRTPDKDYSNISIGTDFDGYSDEPQDLYEASELDALIEALRAEHISDESIRKITSGNALRVLEKGWL